MRRNSLFVNVTDELFLRVWEICNALDVISVARNPLAVAEFSTAERRLVITRVKAGIAPFFHQKSRNKVLPTSVPVAVTK